MAKQNQSKFRNFISRFFMGLAIKANPAGRLFVNTWNDGLQPYPANLEAHGAAWLVNVYVYACQRTIAQDVAATPLLIQERKRVDGEYRWVTLEEGELWELFNRPNPKESWPHLTERLSMALDGTGNAYLSYTTDEGGEFWYVKPDTVKVRADAAGKIVQYEINNGAETMRLDKDDILHFKLANPSGEWYGMPPSKSIEKTILTKNDMNNHLRAFFQNFGQLGLVITTDQDLNSEQREGFRKELRGGHTGVAKWFKELVLSNGLKVDKNVFHAIKDLIPVELDRMLREEIGACYKVPPVKIGVLDGATYANAEAQDEQYQFGAVEPRRQLIERVITDQFLFPKYKDKYRVYYDRTGVQALQEDREQKSVYICREFQSTLITRNQALEKLGYPPIEDEFGEEYYEPVSPFGLTDEGSAISDEGDQSKLRPSAGSKDSGTPHQIRRRNIWKGLDSRNKKRADILYKIVRDYLESQQERILKRINKITGKGMSMSLLRLYLKADIPDGALDFLFSIIEENEILARELGSVLESLSEQAGQDALNAFGIDFEFNVRDPRMQNIIGLFQNRITRINETTWNQLRKLIQDSVQNGDSIEKLAEKIADKYSFTRERARTIAKTETNGISNASSMEGYRQAEIEEKEWLSVQDSRVRDIHAEADGQVRKLNEPFSVGGEELEYPGDPNHGSAYNVINCRCIAAPVIK